MSKRNTRNKKRAQEEPPNDENPTEGAKKQKILDYSEEAVQDMRIEMERLKKETDCSNIQIKASEQANAIYLKMNKKQQERIKDHQHEANSLRLSLKRKAERISQLEGKISKLEKSLRWKEQDEAEIEKKQEEEVKVTEKIIQKVVTNCTNCAKILEENQALIASNRKTNAWAKENHLEHQRKMDQMAKKLKEEAKKVTIAEIESMKLLAEVQFLRKNMPLYLMKGLPLSSGGEHKQTIGAASSSSQAIVHPNHTIVKIEEDDE